MLTLLAQQRCLHDDDAPRYALLCSWQRMRRVQRRMRYYSSRRRRRAATKMLLHQRNKRRVARQQWYGEKVKATASPAGEARVRRAALLMAPARNTIADAACRYYAAAVAHARVTARDCRAAAQPARSAAP